jgi:DNA-binding response OmpR family regulator
MWHTIDKGGPKEPLRHMRILLVEDDDDSATVIARALRREGYSVRVANDADAAILEVVTFWPELAIIDIGLPVMDGYELAERIRVVAHCKLIALSGYSGDSARPATVVSCFDRHMIKPVNFPALLRTIATLAAQADDRDHV